MHSLDVFWLHERNVATAHYKVILLHPVQSTTLRMQVYVVCIHTHVCTCLKSLTKLCGGP